MYLAPRLLQVADEGALRRELCELGFEERDVARFSAEVVRAVVRLSAISAAAANQLRAVAARLGGPEVCIPPLHRDDLLLIGSFSQVRSLAEALRADLALSRCGDDLLAALSVPQVRPQALHGRHCRLELSRPLIMGVLNVTPDSFFPGSRCTDLDTALRRGADMVAEGADLLDVGGESTRPGSVAVAEEEELWRVVPLVEALRRELDVPISVDTTKSRVAQEAVSAGADFINDISGLRFDSQMAAVAAESGAGLFLMHTRGTPERMQQNTDYQDLVGEILAYLHEGVTLALAAGVPREKLALDPGIGFGKSAEGNLEILRRLGEFAAPGYPLLVGTSRKGFIGRVLDNPDPGQRLAGTLATVALAVAEGAHILRVHDVKPARDAAMMAWAIRKGISPQ